MGRQVYDWAAESDRRLNSDYSWWLDRAAVWVCVIYAVGLTAAGIFALVLGRLAGFAVLACAGFFAGLAFMFRHDPREDQP